MQFLAAGFALQLFGGLQHLQKVFLYSANPLSLLSAPKGLDIFPKTLSGRPRSANSPGSPVATFPAVLPSLLFVGLDMPSNHLCPY